MAQGKVIAIEVKKIIEMIIISAIASIVLGVTATLVIVNCIDPICKYADPVYHCQSFIIEPDKCQKIEGGTNTINLNSGY